MTPPEDHTAALCQGTFGDPRGVGVSHERCTPARCGIIDTSMIISQVAWMSLTNAQEACVSMPNAFDTAWGGAGELLRFQQRRDPPSPPMSLRYCLP